MLMKQLFHTSDCGRVGEWLPRGWQETVVPLFRYENLPLDVQSIHWAENHYCIFTSQRAVRAIVDLGLIELLQQHTHIAFYVVGQQTARALLDVGIPATHIATHNMQELATYLLQKNITQRTGIFWGASVLASFTTQWLENNPCCQHIPVYVQHMVEVSTELSTAINNRATCVLATSPSAIRYLSALSVARDIELVVLGTSSLQTAEEEGFQRIHCAPSPSVQLAVEYSVSIF